MGNCVICDVEKTPENTSIRKRVSGNAYFYSYCNDCSRYLKRTAWNKKSPLYNVKKGKKDWEYIHKCRNCHKVMPSNRAKLSDFCGVCMPKFSCRINSCFYCRKPIPVNFKYCDDCRDKGKKHKDSLHKKERKAKIQQYKDELKSMGCVICKYNGYSGALHFHHLGEKGKAISSYRTLSQVKNEIDKGELVVLCSNCHAEVHGGLHDMSKLTRYVLTNGQKQYDFLIGWDDV